jgi:hypothetical protein
MVSELVFHVYKKDSLETKVVAHSLTVDELEERLKNKDIDTSIHEIVPIEPQYAESDASY